MAVIVDYGPTWRRFQCGLCDVLCLICRPCDFGHRYCSTECGRKARRQNRRRAQAYYQHKNLNAHRTAQAASRARKRDQANSSKPVEQACSGDAQCCQDQQAAQECVASAPSTALTATDALTVATSSNAPLSSTGQTGDQLILSAESICGTGVIQAPAGHSLSNCRQLGNSGEQQSVASAPPLLHDVAEFAPVDAITPSAKHLNAHPVTDHSLAEAAKRINVSVISVAEAEGPGAWPTNVARVWRDPLCCSFCARPLALSAGIHHWHGSG